MGGTAGTGEDGEGRSDPKEEDVAGRLDPKEDAAGRSDANDDDEGRSDAKEEGEVHQVQDKVDADQEAHLDPKDQEDGDAGDLDPKIHVRFLVQKTRRISEDCLVSKAAAEPDPSTLECCHRSCLAKAQFL